MNILEKIVARKQEENKINEANISIEKLQKYLHFNRKTISLTKRLKNSDDFGIITEFKKKSPSQSNINLEAKVEIVTEGYTQFGAAGLSVLTDQDFFGGHNHYLTVARNINQIPILRKDFIVSEYQVYEAKAIGADVILLIAECLTAQQVDKLSALAHELGMEVLLEVHTADQVSKRTKNVDILGINNRNLKTFETSIQTSIDIVKNLSIPSDVAIISESGIESPEAIHKLRKVGFDGFLIGTYFMRQESPEIAFKEFVESLQ